MNLNINDDIINLNVSGNSTKIESSNNNIELNISNNNMNVEGESKELNLGILPPKVVVSEKDHNKLLNRDLPNQHPIKSIEGLEENGDGTKFLSDDGTYKGVKIFDDVVEDILVNGASVVDENNNANIFVPTNTSELLNDSGFITNLAKDLVNYYLKSEVYNKEEINQLASTLQNVSITIVDTLPSTGKTNVIYFVSKTGSTNDVYDEWIYVNNAWEHIGSTEVDLTGYATEEWVENQDYIPMTDFQQIMDTFYYDKEEIDTKLEELSTGETELTGGDNTVIEDNKINVYTNTGYKVIDKDIQLQSITDSETTGTNKIVYIEDKEIMIIYDGTNKIRRSENGIDFEVITLPYTCKSMIYNKNSKRIFGLSEGYFIYSDDAGITWETKQSNYANNIDYITLGQPHIKGFITVNKTTRRMYLLTEEFVQNSGYITSTISPDFVTQFYKSQYIWCNVNGIFKYGAGTQEGAFASLSNVTVNMLKTVNSKQMVGLKNNNKIYIIKNLSGTTNEWIPYTLPDTCTVNDIIFNPYDETYYIFTDINTYYKTKDFVNYESVDKDGLRGIQGYFTSMGIQMTTFNHNELLLAPTRTKLENKLQEHDRGLNKSLWVGNGLELTEEGKVNVKISGDNLGVSEYGINLQYVDEYHLTEDIIEALKVAIAKFADEPIDPYAFDGWFWGFGIPSDSIYGATKIVFNQAGSFYNQYTWAEEYVVEQYEYGYIFCDSNMSIFKYVKLGNLSWLMN